jgi:hypothetical protein
MIEESMVSWIALDSITFASFGESPYAEGVSELCKIFFLKKGLSVLM